MKLRLLLAMVCMTLTSKVLVAGELSAQFYRAEHSIERHSKKHDFVKKGRRFGFFKLVTLVNIRFNYEEQGQINDYGHERYSRYKMPFNNYNFPAGPEATAIMNGWAKDICFKSSYKKEMQLRDSGRNIVVKMEEDSLEQIFFRSHDFETREGLYSCVGLFSKAL